MKLNPISTRLPISSTVLDLRKPNPPTAEAVKKAQFVDKTYHWKNAGIRSGDKRTPQ
jgi:hypothetical protein